MVAANQLTLQQFRDNPNIVQSDEIPDLELKRTCVTCGEEKAVACFEETRRECIKCRRSKSKRNIEDQVAKSIASVEQVKTNPTLLKAVLRNIGSDVLRRVTLHYKITTERNPLKDSMVVHMLNYFAFQQNPFLCMGGCNNVLTEVGKTCDPCLKKPQDLREQSWLDFEKMVPTIAANLTEFGENEQLKYNNKRKIVAIARELGIEFDKGNTKESIVKKIEMYFNALKEDNTTIIPNLSSSQIFGDGIKVHSREDGYVNATELCKAGGKLFGGWNRLDSSKELVAYLEAKRVGRDHDGPQEEVCADLHRPPLIDIISTGPNEGRGTWVDPEVAIDIGQWISIPFRSQIITWTREILITGSVNAEHQKTQKELVRLQRENYQLQSKRRRISERKAYHKFKNGPCVYVLTDLDARTTKCKFGKVGESSNINDRLQNYRTSLPHSRLEYKHSLILSHRDRYLVYCEASDTLETCVKYRLKADLVNKNHEWVLCKHPADVIQTIRELLHAIGCEYQEETELDAYNRETHDDYLEMLVEPDE